MIAVVPSATLGGAAGRPPAVEVHVANRFARCTMVGLPCTAVLESCDRVRAAQRSSDLPWRSRSLADLEEPGRGQGTPVEARHLARAPARRAARDRLGLEAAR